MAALNFSSRSVTIFAVSFVGIVSPPIERVTSKAGYKRRPISEPLKLYTNLYHKSNYVFSISISN